MVSSYPTAFRYNLSLPNCPEALDGYRSGCAAETRFSSYSLVIRAAARSAIP
jgi:hypothetical protein